MDPFLGTVGECLGLSFVTGCGSFVTGGGSGVCVTGAEGVDKVGGGS